MKKTLTINLSGIVFNIDEDAYDVLYEYLKKLELRFKGEDGKEIMRDIEARLAELFGEALSHKAQAVVTIDHVNSAIAQLGTVDEIEDEESTIEEKEPKESRKQYRKFYRDGENKILGGVAAGVAAYLGLDTTIVRVVFVVLASTILGGLIPIYLLVWLITPEAKTTAQRLEMQGIEPSIENIKEYLNSERFKESAGRIGSRLGEIMIWLFRIAAITFGLFFIVIGAVVIAALIIALIGIIIGGGNIIGESIGNFIAIEENTSVLIIFITSLLISCLIPIIAIIISTMRIIRKDTMPRKKGWGWIWFIIWIIASLITIGTLAINAPKVIRIVESIDDYYDDDDDYYDDYYDDDNIYRELKVESVCISGLEGIKSDSIQNTVELEIDNGTNLDSTK